MGHSYIEALPRTLPWRHVVTRIERGDDARTVADAVVDAACKFLGPLPTDDGVVEAVWHLIRLPVAARADDFPAALRRLGLDVGDAPGLMDLIAATSDAVDAALPPGRRTDLGEMAQTALAETLADELGVKTGGLFGENPTAPGPLLAAAATVRQFGRLAVAYFARLVRKLLDFFVGRTLADHVGAGRRFRTLAHQAEFTAALATYAREVAAGVEVYAGGWFSKWNYLSDNRISKNEAGAFLAHCSHKLDWALARG